MLPRSDTLIIAKETLQVRLKLRATAYVHAFRPLYSNNKITIVAQGDGHGDGHSGLNQQPTMKLTTLFDAMVL
jgi:hypothetical protein